MLQICYRIHKLVKCSVPLLSELFYAVHSNYDPILININYPDI